MKLLSKNEVERLKSSERKQEIDEGIKIARKIDELRNTLGKEESNLSKFRDQTIKLVKSDLDDLISKRDSLQKETDNLTIKKEELLKPYTEEWEEISRFKREDLKIMQDDLDKKENDLGRLSLILEERRINLDLIDTDTNKKNQEIIILRSTTESFKQQAEHKLNEVRVKEAQVNSRIDARENNVKKLEESVLVREVNLNLKEEKLNKQEQYLKDQERFINSKYQTLLVTERALKQNAK